MLDCLSNAVTAPGTRDYLDWCYFFMDKDSIGHTTSEITRQIAGRCICPEISIGEFLCTSWYHSMSHALNHSALGFIVESMVISWIATKGCPALGATFASISKHKFFSTSQPVFKNNPGTTIYIPGDFNYKAVDATGSHRTGQRESPKRY